MTGEKKIQCPSCGSDDIEAIPLDCDTGFCACGDLECMCNKCGKRFRW